MKKVFCVNIFTFISNISQKCFPPFPDSRGRIFEEKSQKCNPDQRSMWGVDVLGSCTYI